MTQSTSSPQDAFNDSLSFVKKMWGTMSVPGMDMPGMSVPTMSLDELDKRIQEMKTVETWLSINMSMLRNTIQALEIQRATIATLHSLSSTMAQTMQGAHLVGEGEEKKASSTSPADFSPLLAQSAVWWTGVQEQFKQALGTALASSVASSGVTEVAEGAEEVIKPVAAKSASKETKAAKPKPKSAPKSDTQN